MPGCRRPGFDTLALHAGATPRPRNWRTRRAHPPDDVASCSSPAIMRHLCSAWSAVAIMYSRINNPTNAVFEQRMAALEGGAGAIAVASSRPRCT